jgi:hypothetical protein
MLRSAYTIVAVALTISANHWQPPPADVPTSADLCCGKTRSHEKSGL